MPIFAILALTGLAWIALAPAQYTLVGYWIAPAAVIFSLQAVRSGRRLIALLTLAGGTLCALLVSAEQALALFVGTWIFVIVFRRRELAGMLFFSIVALGMFAVAYQARAFRTLFAIGSGAYAVPLVPSLIAALVVVLLAIAACTLVEALRTQREGGIFELLICLLIPSLTAAFGRCDPYHLLANGFSGALVGCVVAARNDRLWRVLFWTFAIAYPYELKRIYFHEGRVLVDGMQDALSLPACAATDVLRPDRCDYVRGRESWTALRGG